MYSVVLPFSSTQEREEQEQVEEARRRAYEAEMARLEREAEERKKQRQEQEHQEIKRKHVRERLEELRKTPQGSKIFQNIDEDVSSLMKLDAHWMCIARDEGVWEFSLAQWASNFWNLLAQRKFHMSTFFSNELRTSISWQLVLVKQNY